MSTLAERIRSCLVDGRSQAGLARACGIKQPSVHGWLSGKTKHIEGANLLRAAAYLGVNPEWLATGRGPKYAGQDQTGPVSRVPSPSDTVIHHLNVAAKAGGGGLAPSEEYIIDSITVSNRWIRQRLPAITSRHNLAVIEVYGRSMEPTLMSGDLLIVDTGVRQATIDGIYILQRLNTPEPEIMVKRIQRLLDGGLIVKSDNRAEYEPEKVPADQIQSLIRVLGRVVWVWAGREA